MHIIIGLLGVIGLIGVVLWRIKLGIEASREIAGAARDAKNYMRRRRWQKKAEADMIAEIEDPREAAATMMAALAMYEGPISEVEQQTILSQIKENFGANDMTATELYSHARWLAKEAGDLNAFLARLTPPVVRNCSMREKHDLVEMLTAVANADGKASDLEQDSINFVKRHLGL